MRAWRVHDSSAAEDGLTLVDLPSVTDPEALVIEVRAAGVGFPDLLMRRGEFQIRQPEPFTLGWEAAGIVRSAPPDGELGVGDRVVSLTFGAFAEELVAVPEATFALSDEVSFERGAALPLNYFTALAGLERRGGLRPGERVLVQGAAGGTGTAAIQVARALGAGQVIGVVSSEEKAQLAREAGAHDVVLAHDGWRNEVLERSGGGVDLVYDPVGGDRFADSLRCLASEGRLIVIGFAAGSIPELAVNRLLLRSVDVRGCTWTILAAGDGGLPAAARRLNAWAVDGTIDPPIGAVYDFEQLPDALVALDQREARGKLVLRVG